MGVLCCKKNTNNLENLSESKVVRIGEGTMTIKAKSLINKVYHLGVESTDTILNVKKLICRTDGILTVETIRVMFNGKSLEDTKTLADYNIVENTTLLFMLQKPEKLSPF